MRESKIITSKIEEGKWKETEMGRRTDKRETRESKIIIRKIEEVKQNEIKMGRRREDK